jgi:hypothetical protein
MKREGIVPPTEPELPPVVNEAVATDGKLQTRTGHVTLMKKDGKSPPNPPKDSGNDISVIGFEPEVVKAPGSRTAPSGSNEPNSPPNSEKIKDPSQKEKEYKGHVTLLKRESMLPPPEVPASPQNTDLINPIAMDKGLRVLNDTNDSNARKLLDRGQAGENMNDGSSPNQSVSVKDKDKKKEVNDGKKEYVGHVSLMK